MLLLTMLLALATIKQPPKPTIYHCQLLHHPTEGRYVCHVGNHLIKFRAEKIKVIVEKP